MIPQMSYAWPINVQSLSLSLFMRCLVLLMNQKKLCKVQSILFHSFFSRCSTSRKIDGHTIVTCTIVAIWCYHRCFMFASRSLWLGVLFHEEYIHYRHLSSPLLFYIAWNNPCLWFYCLW